MRIQAAVLAVLLLSASLVPPSVETNEPPLADAGLDQTVQRGTTVHLDASGSRDPDGTIETLEWSIRPPDGGPTTPACSTCARTRFTPDRVGTYEVTVAVTDDDGATAQDTLYVHVEPGEPPSVTVAGPTDVQAGSSLTYVATVEAGTARLSTLTWRVDGLTVRTETVEGTQRRFDLPHTFENERDYELTVTVEDADGVTDTDALVVRAESINRPDENETGTNPGGNRGGSGEPAQTIASQANPVIRGEQLLTGDGPFEESYHLDADTDAVSQVTWWRNGRRATTGANARLSWSPGTHHLYAVVEYTDGSTATARFPSGTTDVEVDPEPQVELLQIDSFGSLTGVLTGTDEFDNLRSVAVSVNGEQVAMKSVDPLELRVGQSGGRLDLAFEYEDIDPGETHRVVLRARDARGQIAEEVERIEAVGIPEVVRSEFVNDTVDSYHPRLDPERYTAKHVLEVKLNGMDPENINVLYDGRRNESMNIGREQMVTNQGDLLRIISDWAGENPNQYKINIIISYRFKKEVTRLGILQDSFVVTSSPPESRIEVISDINPSDNRANGGLLVEMSGSFDPDGTALKYAWTNGSRATTEDFRIGEVRDLDSVALRLEDGDDEVTHVSAGEMLDYYSPPVRVTELAEGPYKQNETVVFNLDSTSFTLSRRSLHEFIPAAIRTESYDGNLRDWKCLIVGTVDESLIEEKGLDCMSEYHPKWYDSYQHFYRGELAFEASTFAEGNTPEVYIINENKPHKSERRLEFPSIDIMEKGGRYVSDVDVVSTSYLVEKPVVVRKETPFKTLREQYLSEGFEVERTEMSGTEYTLEEHVKVQDAKYETEEETFESRGVRNTFLQQNPEWERGETKTEVQKWTTTEREWRDSRTGPGEFTGSTRQVEVEPAQYRYEKKYRHYYTVERTGTREVTRQRTVRVPVTRYRTKEICVAHGCYLVEESYTEWVTRTSTYTTTEEYTYTVTESSTYWSTNKLNADHEFTGQTRRVEVKPAEYKQQYEYEFEKTHEELVWFYTAQRTFQVRPAKFEWQEYKTTKSEVEAKSAEMSPDKRIAETSPAKVWFLVKQTGLVPRWIDEPRDPTDVIETRAAMNETYTRVYVDSASGEEVLTEEKSEIIIYKFNGYISSGDMVDSRLNESVDGEPDA